MSKGRTWLTAANGISLGSSLTKLPQSLYFPVVVTGMNQINLRLFIVMLQEEYLNAMSGCVDKYVRGKRIHDGASPDALLLHVIACCLQGYGTNKVKLLNTVYRLRSESSLDFENTFYMN